MATVFTDLNAAFDELEWLVEQTGRTHLLKKHGLKKFKVIREYITSDNGTIVARMAPKRDFQALQHQKVIRSAA